MAILANERDSPTRVIAGAMSGTSADGVDVAVVKIAGIGTAMIAQLLRHHHDPYDPALRSRIVGIRAAGQATLGEMASVTHDISMAYAAAVGAASDGQQIDAIAAHGQTMFHAPPCTMQWLDPALLAASTRRAVVSDFRRADCAAGGQGAPLVPFADYVLFRHSIRHRVLLNIGGIANLTYLPAGGAIESLVAFDTGPGNCISDFLLPPFDPRGDVAAAGVSIESILNRALADEYFQRPPPKSTDGPAMIAVFDDDLTLPLADRLFTACQLTATTIARAIAALPEVDEIIASGGGTENRTLMRLLRDATGIAVRTTDELGVPSQAKEAIAFALLGAATLDHIPANVPACTGATRAVVLGSITPKPI